MYSPGTPVRRWSRARSDRTGPTPARIWQRWSIPRSRTSAIQRPNAATSNTNWVCTNSAPAAAFLASRAARNPTGGANGFSTAPMSQPGLPVSARPDIVRATHSSCTLSRSNTGSAPGWSPNLGWSPVISSTLGMPMAQAASRSDWSASRLRSRQVTCMTGSIPAWAASRLPAQLAIRTFAPALSVMLTASTQPRSCSALRSSAPGSAPRGGPISAVTVNDPDPSRARRPDPLISLPSSRDVVPEARRRGAGSGGRGPQVLVLPAPVADPGAPPGPPLVHRALEQQQVSHAAFALGPRVGGHPHAPGVREHFAGAVRADAAARAVAQLLGAGLRAGVPGDREGALPAHPAAERRALGRPLGGGEGPVGRRGSGQRAREPAVGGVGRQHALEAVGKPAGQPRPDRPRPASPARRGAGRR